MAGGTSHWIETSEADFKKGTFQNLVATNLGDLKLSREVRMLLTTDPKVSAVYAMVEGPDKTIYAGTGPEGVLLEIKDGKVSTALTLESGTSILSLAIDGQGRLLIGTGGEAGRVLIVDKPGDAPREIFSEKEVQYVWSVKQTDDGTIYAATGPNGQLFAIKPDGTHELLFDSNENNLLSLASDGKDFLFVGTDPNGLIYRVNRKSREVFVTFDAAESEISALVFDRAGNLYAATAEAEGATAGAETAAATDQHGRPESPSATVPLPSPAPPENPPPPQLPDPNPGEPPPIPSHLPDLNIGDLKKTLWPGRARVRFIDDAPAAPDAPTPGAGQADATTTAPTPQLPPGPGTGAQQPRALGNAVYKIDPDGFVSEIVRQPVMALSLLETDGGLLIGTGSEGLVYQVNSTTEETLVIARVEPKQVMHLFAASDGQIYLGLANAGGIATLSAGLAGEGTYISSVLDASQISRFGKMHLQGSLPAGTQIQVSTRSGNVADASQLGWSDWSKEMPATRFLPVAASSARYLQYRLKFTGKDAKDSPTVEVIDIAYQMPNLAPAVSAVRVVDPPAEQQTTPPIAAPSKLQISWDAADPNADALEFAVSYRSDARRQWILVKEKLKEATLEFDTRAVPDGRYEIRIQASDASANPPGAGKLATRLSDPVFVDNTPPVIGNLKAEVGGGEVTVTARLFDRTTSIAGAFYSVDARDDWQLTSSSDKIFDSSDEEVAFVVRGLAPGEHQITLRAADSRGNVAFENVLVTLEADAAKK